MLGRDMLAEEGGFLESNCGDGRIVGQVILLAHRLVLDQRAIFLEQTGVVSLRRISFVF